MRWLAQVFNVTWFGLQTIPQRMGSSAAAVFGIAGVVGVLVGVLSIGQGFRAAMEVAGSDDMAIVLRGGSTGEMQSLLAQEETLVVADTEGVAFNAEGAMSAAELFVIIDLPSRSRGTTANVPLRGVDRQSFEVRGDIEIVEGRTFEWGRNEVIVGVGASRTFVGLDLGSTIEVASDRWEIVGLFAANGGISESEVWTDSRILQSAYQREGAFQAVYTRLSEPEVFTDFKDELDTDPRVDVDVKRSTDFYSEQSEMITTLITVIGYLIAWLMGIGAVFGAVNTMYTAVSARTREIATLRALGFKNSAVVISVLFESLMLGLLGSVIGSGVAWVIFNGTRASTMNWQSFSQVTFAFQVTPALLITGAIGAAIIGLVGGIFPAIRAARMPIAAGLREG